MNIKLILKLVEDFLELKNVLVELVNEYSEKKDKKALLDALNNNDIWRVSQLLGLYSNKNNSEPGLEPGPGGPDNKDNR